MKKERKGLEGTWSHEASTQGNCIQKGQVKPQHTWELDCTLTRPPKTHKYPEYPLPLTHEYLSVPLSVAGYTPGTRASTKSESNAMSTMEHR